MQKKTAFRQFYLNILLNNPPPLELRLSLSLYTNDETRPEIITFPSSRLNLFTSNSCPLTVITPAMVSSIINSLLKLFTCSTPETESFSLFSKIILWALLRFAFFRSSIKITYPHFTHSLILMRELVIIEQLPVIYHILTMFIPLK